MATDGTIAAGGTGLRSYEDYVNSQSIRTPNQDLGKNDFLNILVAQMKYQDPMEPTSDTAFVAQLAQFSQLEQINALNDTMVMFQSYSLAGKFVYGEHRGTDGTVTEVAGFVKSVFQSNGEAWAQVGDQTIRCSEITEVMDGASATGENPLLENASLIGKYVEGKTLTTQQVAKTDSDGNIVKDTQGNIVYDTITTTKVHQGVVVRVAVTEEDGMVAFLDNGDKVPLSNISDIRNEVPGPTLNEDGSKTYYDGRIEYADGSIKYPSDGRIEYTDGTIKYADGGVKHPGDDNIYYENGMVKLPDGTMISAEDLNKETDTDSGSTDNSGGDTTVDPDANLLSGDESTAE